MLVIFLVGLPPCHGTGDAVISKICEFFRKGFPFVEGADTLFNVGAIFQNNGNPHFMDSPTFVARNEDSVQGLGIHRSAWTALPFVRFSCIEGLRY